MGFFSDDFKKKFADGLATATEYAKKQGEIAKVQLAEAAKEVAAAANEFKEEMSEIVSESKNDSTDGGRVVGSDGIERTMKVTSEGGGFNNSAFEKPEMVKRVFRLPNGCVYRYTFTSATATTPWEGSRLSSDTPAEEVPVELWEGIKYFNNKDADTMAKLGMFTAPLGERIYGNPLELIAQQAEHAMSLPRGAYFTTLGDTTYFDLHDTPDNRFNISSLIDQNTVIKNYRMPNGVIFEYSFKGNSSTPFMRRYIPDAQYYEDIPANLVGQVYTWNYVFNEIICEGVRPGVVSIETEDGEYVSAEEAHRRYIENEMQRQEEMGRREAQRSYNEYLRNSYIQSFQNQYGSTPENTPYDWLWF